MGGKPGNLQKAAGSKRNSTIVAYPSLFRSSNNLESEAEQSMKLQCPGAGLLRIPVQKPKMPAVASVSN